MVTWESYNPNFSQNPKFKRGNFIHKSTSQGSRRAYGVQEREGRHNRRRPPSKTPEIGHCKWWLSMEQPRKERKMRDWPWKGVRTSSTQKKTTTNLSPPSAAGKNEATRRKTIPNRRPNWEKERELRKWQENVGNGRTTQGNQEKSNLSSLNASRRRNA